MLRGGAVAGLVDLRAARLASGALGRRGPELRAAHCRTWLRTPLAEGLPGLDHRPIADAARSAGTTPGSLTIGDVFSQSKPSVKLLLAIKEWARSSTRAKEPPLPTELASLLYFASIVAAK